MRTPTNNLRFLDHRQHLAKLRSSAMRVADPARAVALHLQLEGDLLSAGDHQVRLHPSGQIYLVAIGKAAAAMTRAAVDRLGDHIHRGVATIPQGVTSNLPPRIQTYIAGHPLPDSGSLEAGEAVSELLSETTRVDLVLVMISGGGSAMLELPRAGVRLPELQEVNRLLLRSGAPIRAVNIVRQTLSRVKAGGLTRLAAPAPVIALILSDVVGDPLSIIASGPTVLRRPPPDAAQEVLRTHQIWEAAPTSIRDALLRSRSLAPAAVRPRNILIGNNRAVVDSAAGTARKLGFDTQVLSYRMTGEAREVGRRLARRMLNSRSKPTGAKLPPHCWLMGGETTVTVRGSGSGGRNQELALAGGLVIENEPGVVLMAYATDGIDGPTNAAGAIVTGDTLPAIRSLGLNPEAMLAANDSYPLLEAVKATLKTGLTGTNLNDLVIGLAYPPEPFS